MEGSGWLQNLSAALDAAGFDLAQVGHRLKNPEWLAAALRDAGHSPLSAGQFLLISAVTNIPVPVLTGEVPPYQSAGIALRAREKRTGADALLPAYQRGVEFLQVTRLLNSWNQSGRNVQLRKLRAVISNHQWPPKSGEETARQVRLRMEKWGWLERTAPIIDLVGVIERTGIPVEFTHIFPDGVHGLTVHDGALGVWDGVILINANDYWTRQRYTLAHEWAHALFADAETSFVNDNTTVESSIAEEVRAESFAHNLLAPAPALKQQWQTFLRARRGVASSAVCDLMLHFGLSRDAVAIALRNLGVDQETLQMGGSVTSQMNSAGLGEAWTAACADQHVAGASPWLMESALQRYAEGKVSAGTVARVLGRPTAEVAAELTAQGWTTASSD